MNPERAIIPSADAPELAPRPGTAPSLHPHLDPPNQPRRDRPEARTRGPAPGKPSSTNKETQ